MTIRRAIKWFGVLWLVFGPWGLSPQFAWSQETGFAHLRLPAGAVGSALGDAVAVLSGYDAICRQPAVLDRLPVGGAATHRIWLSSQRTYTLAVRTPLRGVGVCVSGLDYGELEAREAPGPAIGTFSARYVTAGIGLGRSVGRYAFGGMVRWLGEELETARATGWSFDVGIQAQFFDGDLLLGALIQHVGEMETLSQQRTQLPSTVRAGATAAVFHLTGEDGREIVNAALLVEHSYLWVDGLHRWHIGTETTLFTEGVIRMGYTTGSALHGFTAGLGFTQDRIRVDYALVPFKQGFGGSGHVFSVSLVR